MRRGPKNKPGDQLDPEKAGAPVYRSPYEGRFASPEDAKRVLRAVARFLRASSNPARPGHFQEEAIGFAVEFTEVRPSTGTRIRMETRFASGTVILHVPRGQDESDESFEVREERILSRFQSSVYEAQMRSAWEFYWALDDKGKQVLLDKYGEAALPKVGEELRP